mmetsp:Transcript_63195/g.131449  ORF Transcript_63195/g.131449 Transcript_63195/m.131449 type:complete len:341 (+) Transcript_63195:120-1142(+)
MPAGCYGGGGRVLAGQETGRRQQGGGEDQRSLRMGARMVEASSARMGSSSWLTSRSNFSPEFLRSVSSSSAAFWHSRGVVWAASALKMSLIDLPSVGNVWKARSSRCVIQRCSTGTMLPQISSSASATYTCSSRCLSTSSQRVSSVASKGSRRMESRMKTCSGSRFSSPESEIFCDSVSATRIGGSELSGERMGMCASEVPSAWYRCSLGEAMTAEKSRSLSALSASVYASLMVACDCSTGARHETPILCTSGECVLAITSCTRLHTRLHCSSCGDSSRSSAAHTRSSCAPTSHHPSSFIASSLSSIGITSRCEVSATSTSIESAEARSDADCCPRPVMA